ncbi:hypothetical protein L8R46_24655, partial [Enterobacter roggenkampii]
MCQRVILHRRLPGLRPCHRRCRAVARQPARDACGEGRQSADGLLFTFTQRSNILTVHLQRERARQLSGGGTRGTRKRVSPLHCRQYGTGHRVGSGFFHPVVQSGPVTDN